MYHPSRVFCRALKRVKISNVGKRRRHLQAEQQQKGLWAAIGGDEQFVAEVQQRVADEHGAALAGAGSSARAVDWQHNDAVTSMKLSQAVAGKTLIEENLRRGNVASAADILYTMKQVGVAAERDSYHRVIAAWLERGNTAQAFDWAQKMRRDGREPDRRTFAVLINGCARLAEPQRAAAMHRAIALLNSFELSPQQVIEPDADQPGAADNEHPTMVAHVTDPRLLVVCSRPAASDAAEYDQQQAQWAVSSDHDPVSLLMDESTSTSTSTAGSTEAATDSFGDNSNRALFEQQLALESDATDEAVRRYHKLLKVITKLGQGASLKPAQAVLLSWYRPLVRRIKAEQKTALLKTDRTRSFLLLLPAQKLAVIAMHQALGLTLRSPQGVTFTTAAMTIGKSMQAEVNLHRLKQERGDIYGFLNRRSKVLTVNTINKMEKLMENGKWERTSLVQLGACLLKCLMESCQVGVITSEHGRPPAIVPLEEEGELDDDVEFNLRFGEDGEGRDDDAAADSAPDHALDDEQFHEEFESEMRKFEQQFDALARIEGDDDAGAPSSEDARAPSSATSSSSSPQEQRRPRTRLLGPIRPSSSDDDGDDENVQVKPSAVPAFRHSYRFRGVLRTGMFSAHPQVFSLIERGHRLRETVDARHLPMIVEPRAWTDTNQGGYLLSRVRVMRTRGSTAQQRALNGADLTSVYAALTALGKTPWQVNEPVCRVAWEAWGAGGALAELPPRIDDPEPLPPDDPSDLAAMQLWRNARRAVTKRNAELHSMRCDTRYKLQLAREFAGRTIYFPHNLDFRGRVYPIPPHLNHMGSDLCRGLLQFAEARPLGPDGHRWLKIQLANVYGHGKLSFQEREDWVDQHMDLVVRAADGPLTDERGRDFWTGGEDPWQVLAACFELAAVERWPGRKADYQSCLPVHQDGTCNGLQHYAALGGDAAGARAVNLAQAVDRPQDVYAEVAVLVERAARADPSELGQLCAGLVSRRIVKQTVMTSVYGVTFVGANLQIRRQLEGLVPSEQLSACSAYLTRKTFEALREMFVSARGIMEWLAQAARLVGRHKQAVAWTTPLGLRCVQPYRRSNSKLEVKTLVQTVILVDDNDALPVNVQRQATAFPPNYIHSLDSTHLMLTALACERQGLPFAAVHDSFWSHAGEVDRLARTLRNEFVDLHRLPLLDRLRQELQFHTPGLTLPEPPVRGDFDISEVIEAPYFFS